MIRLNIVAEGQTEEAFVNAVLVEHLAGLSVAACVRCVETSRDKRRARVYRGGLLDYQRAKRDLLRWMKQDQNADAHFTTMFDLYRLPRDFPGYDQVQQLSDPFQKIAALETAFRQDIDHPRFVPYIQLHEFEALLLADPLRFDWAFIDHDKAIQNLLAMAAAFETPELIDDGDNTSPCHRIVKEIPEYADRKTSAGPLIAAKIGLPVLRQKCPHFNQWLESVEALGK